MDVEEEVAPRKPDPSPGTKPDDKPSEKTYTKADLEDYAERKLKGSGKELAKLQKENEEIRKRLEAREAADLTEQEKQAKRLAELEKEAEEAATLRQREQARLERLAERNADRIKALPKDSKEKDTAKKWAEKLNADDFAELLDDLEKQVDVRDVHGGGGRSRSPADEAEMKRQQKEKNSQRGRDFIHKMGGDK